MKEASNATKYSTAKFQLPTVKRTVLMDEKVNSAKQFQLPTVKRTQKPIGIAKPVMFQLPTVKRTGRNV